MQYKTIIPKAYMREKLFYYSLLPVNYGTPFNVKGLLYLILVYGLNNHNPWSVLAVPISAAMINPNIESPMFVLSIPF